jgi:O-antigen ligase
MSAQGGGAALLLRERVRFREAWAAVWALPNSLWYQKLVTIWLGVFCAGFCLLPAEWEQRWLFYIGIPLALPAVVDAARRLARGPLFWSLAAFLAYSAISALWSGRWMTISDEVRRALWIEYFLLICCFIGASSIIWLRTVLEALLLFSAAVAVLTLIEFYSHCDDCLRFSGYGRHAKATWTAMIFGAVAIIGLSIAFAKRGRMQLLLLACQAPLCVVVIATGSRGGLPSYIVATLISAFLILRRTGERRTLLAVGTALGCVVVAVAAVAMLGTGWLEHQLERGDSHRFELWRANLRRIGRHPWFGHGATAWDQVHLHNGDVVTHAHNLFLSQAYYGGLVGLTLWIAVFVFAVRVGIRALRERGELLPLMPIVFLLMVGCADIGSVVTDVQPEWLYVWVVFGIALAYDVDFRRSARTSRYA